MNQLLLTMAQRAGTDKTLMASLIEQYAEREGLIWEQVADHLEIETMQLAKLALCKQPRQETFTQDIAQIASHAGLNRLVLTHFITRTRHGLPLRNKTKPEPTVRKEKRSMFNRRVWALGFAALLVLILGTFVLAQPAGATATLVVSEGQATVDQSAGALLSGGGQMAVAAGDVVTVKQGDTIRLADDATAQIRLQDGSTVDLLAGTMLSVSELVMDEDSYQVRLRLLTGQTINRVVRLLQPGDSFDVQTPSSTASVRGTVFTVEVLGAEATFVSVDEGIVRVTMGNQYIDVNPSFEVTAVVGQPLQVVPSGIEPPVGPPTPVPPDTRPTHTPEPIDTPETEDAPEPTNTPTAVPFDDKDKQNDVPESVPGNPPEEVPGEGDPPEGGAEPPGQENDGSGEKMIICHYPSENATDPVTLEIAADALLAHQAHGDTIGACPAPAEDGNPSDSNNNGNSGGNNGGGNK